MGTFNQILETALKLSYEQQEMLIKVLQKRYYESRRAKIPADAQQSLADFHSGNFRSQSFETIIAALRQSLSDLEI